jgi:hypothetical protein
MLLFWHFQRVSGDRVTSRVNNIACVSCPTRAMEPRLASSTEVQFLYLSYRSTGRRRRPCLRRKAPPSIPRHSTTDAGMSNSMCHTPATNVDTYFTFSLARCSAVSYVVDTFVYILHSSHRSDACARRMHQNVGVNKCSRDLKVNPTTAPRRTTMDV